MAETAKVYGSFLIKALNKEINWIADAIKVMLCTSAYVPNQDTHAYKSDITNEVTGAGYTAGGVTLLNKSIAYTSETNVLKLDADDIVIPNSTITARYAVFYDDTPATDATKPLIAYVDFGEDKISGNGNFSMTMNDAGFVVITMA